MNDEIYERNMMVLNSATSKAFEYLKRLENLPFYDKTNFEKNKATLRLVKVIDDGTKLYSDNHVALYVPATNELHLQDKFFHNQYINENVLTMIILHELVHMASTDLDKNSVGFEYPEHADFPHSYNEGCTQYITLKLMLGNQLDEAIKINDMYPESTQAVKKCVDLLGEEKIFSGFFEASLKKEVDGFTPRELDQWNDIVFEMSQSKEEEMIRSAFTELEENVDEFAGKNR